MSGETRKVCRRDAEELGWDEGTPVLTCGSRRSRGIGAREKKKRKGKKKKGGEARPKKVARFSLHPVLSAGKGRKGQRPHTFDLTVVGRRVCVGFASS